jgi:hypothetical protein
MNQEILMTKQPSQSQEQQQEEHPQSHRTAAQEHDTPQDQQPQHGYAAQQGGGPSSSSHQRKITLIPLVFLIYFEVAGGPYGSEKAVRAAGPLFTLLGFLIFPFAWGVPESLVTAELASAFPGNGGFVLWADHAFGPLAGRRGGPAGADVPASAGGGGCSDRCQLSAATDASPDAWVNGYLADAAGKTLYSISMDHISPAFSGKTLSASPLTRSRYSMMTDLWPLDWHGLNHIYIPRLHADASAAGRSPKRPDARLPQSHIAVLPSRVLPLIVVPSPA